MALYEARLRWGNSLTRQVPGGGYSTTHRVVLPDGDPAALDPAAVRRASEDALREAYGAGSGVADGLAVYRTELLQRVDGPPLGDYRFGE